MSKLMTAKEVCEARVKIKENNFNQTISQIISKVKNSYDPAGELFDKYAWPSNYCFISQVITKLEELGFKVTAVSTKIEVTDYKYEQIPATFFRKARTIQKEFKVTRDITNYRVSACCGEEK